MLKSCKISSILATLIFAAAAMAQPAPPALRPLAVLDTERLNNESYRAAGAIVSPEAYERYLQEQIASLQKSIIGPDGHEVYLNSLAEFRLKELGELRRIFNAKERPSGLELARYTTLLTKFVIIQVWQYCLQHSPLILRPDDFALACDGSLCKDQMIYSSDIDLVMIPAEHIGSDKVRLLRSYFLDMLAVAGFDKVNFLDWSDIRGAIDTGSMPPPIDLSAAMEAQFITGSRQLFETAKDEISRYKRGHGIELARHRLAFRILRLSDLRRLHAGYMDDEPSIKKGLGGLRETIWIMWLCEEVWDMTPGSFENLRKEIGNNRILSEEELDSIKETLDFILMVRNEHGWISGNKERVVLDADSQIKIAQVFPWLKDRNDLMERYRRYAEGVVRATREVQEKAEAIFGNYEPYKDFQSICEGKVNVEKALELAERNNAFVKMALAWRCSEPRVLEVLSDSNEWLILFGLARNPATPPEVLARLSALPGYFNRDIRLYVARNENAPPEVLMDLSEDEYQLARESANDGLKRLLGPMGVLVPHDRNIRRGRIDLHAHTYYSDGRFSPEQVVQAARYLGLKAIAICDHNTVGGIEEAVAAGRRNGVAVVPALEINSLFGRTGVHILGYNVDCQNPKFVKGIEENRRKYERRFNKILENLKRVGVSITIEEVRQIAGHSNLSMDHLASTIVQKGYVENNEEAQQKFLKASAPEATRAYEPNSPEYNMSTLEAISLIKAAGGIPVLAHPCKLVQEIDMEEVARLIQEEFIPAGLMGIEVFYSSHTEEQRRHFLELTNRHNLLIFGGSDYHYVEFNQTKLGMGLAGRLDLDIPYYYYLKSVLGLPYISSARLEADIPRMSVEEKVAQLIRPGLDWPQPTEEDAYLLQRFGVPSGRLNDRDLKDPRNVAEVVADIASLVPQPLLLNINQEGGRLNKLDIGNTQMPGNMAVGALGSEEEAYAAGAVMAKELRALGITWNFAPVADVIGNYRNPVVGTRSFGDEPQMVARLTAAFIKGIQENGVAATVKHFPGHGTVILDTHDAIPVIQNVSDEDLLPFKAAIDADVATVMPGHFIVASMDKGNPASLSKPILTGLLREKMGFKGIIVTDNLSMAAMLRRCPIGETAVRAIEAGADIVLVDPDISRRKDSVEEERLANERSASLKAEVYQALVKAVKDGRISVDRIDESLRRVMALREKYGLKSPPIPSEARDICGSQANRIIETRIAESSITLLRNERRGDTNLLPLWLSKDQKLLVVRTRPNLARIDSSHDRGFALGARIRERHPNTEYIVAGSAEEMGQDKFAGADAIIIGTYMAHIPEPDGSYQQVQLVKKALASGKPVVVVAMGDPYDILEFPEARTYLASYGVRNASMEAAARILFGEITPSGTLPVTIQGLYDRGEGLNNFEDNDASKPSAELLNRAAAAYNTWLESNPGASLSAQRNQAALLYLAYLRDVKDPYLALKFCQRIFDRQDNPIIHQAISFISERYKLHDGSGALLLPAQTPSILNLPEIISLNLDRTQAQLLEFAIRLALGDFVFEGIDARQIRTRQEWLELQREKGHYAKGYSEFISQQKSVLVLETFFGCHLGCAYCFRHIDAPARAERVIGDEEIIINLLNHPFFLIDKTPLSIHCNSSEPFLQTTKDSTFRVLEILDRLGFRNIVSLITKAPLSEKDIQRLEGFKNLDIEVCVSYSEMPKEVEPIGNTARIKLLRRLGRSKLRTLLFYRPLIVGWNTSDEQIRRVLSVAKEAGVDAIMVGGIRLSYKERKRIREAGLELPPYETENFKKFLPRDLIGRLLQIYKELGLGIPMVRRTSCGRSVIRGIPDYNAHWAQPHSNCWESCPFSQRERCASKQPPSRGEIRELLERIDMSDIGFYIDNARKALILDGDISQLEINFLRANLNISVEVKPSEPLKIQLQTQLISNELVRILADRNYERNRDEIEVLIAKLHKPRPVQPIIISADRRIDSVGEVSNSVAEVGGEPAIRIVLDNISELAEMGVEIARPIVVVSNHNSAQVKEALEGYDVDYVIQDPLAGTGHAVLQAKGVIPANIDDGLIMLSTMTVVRPETLYDAILIHQSVPGCAGVYPVAWKEKPYAPLKLDGAVILDSLETHQEGRGAPDFGPANVGTFIVSLKEAFAVLEGYSANFDSSLGIYKGLPKGELGFPNIIGRNFPKQGKLLIAAPVADPRECQAIKTQDDCRRAEKYRRELAQAGDASEDVLQLETEAMALQSI